MTTTPHGAAGLLFLPCPMCGNDDIRIETPHFADESVPAYRWHWAQCSCCGLRTRGADTPLRASMRWNTRDNRNGPTEKERRAAESPPSKRAIDLFPQLSDERSV